jgi:ABC-2 type transport system ATP-binding protein
MNMIHVQGLEKHYGDLHALRGISFAVERGEVVGFLGPNGAGKSTTMKILTGYLVPDGGSCQMAGIDVVPGDPGSRRNVGYLPESTPLYRGMRVDRYLDFVAGLHGQERAERKASVGRVIEACRLGRHAGRRIGWLSKGFRQRVGLAQALLGEPDVLILDEPTSGLDPREVVRMRALISELGKEKTVLLSTHILSEVEATCSRVIVIAGGQIVADATPMEIARSGEAELTVVLRVPQDQLTSFSTAAIGRDLAHVPGVSRLISSEDCGGGTVRLVLDVRRAPGSLARSGEPVAELVADTLAKRGWKISELTRRSDDFEAAFLEITDPNRMAMAGPLVRGDVTGPTDSESPEIGSSNEIESLGPREGNAEGEGGNA